MSRALFVSDIHIKSVDDERAELFRRFLLKCLELQPQHLFLVGDIFDLWIADRDYFVESYRPLIDLLIQLKHQGTHIHYFEGNHDLDLRLYWQHKLGFDVYDGPAFFEIHQHKIRVEHGDQMDPEDRGYLFLRWLLRTPLVRFLGRYLPNSLVRKIGREAAAASRDYTTQIKTATDEVVREKIRKHTERVYAENPFAMLISGHVHVHQDRMVDVRGVQVRSVNLGTWLKEPLVFEITDQGASLIPIKSFL